MVGIYWNNHHHLMQVVDTIDGRTLWANMHLLFWLSLTPLARPGSARRAWRPGPVAAYAIVLLGCAIAFTLLTLSLLALHESELAARAGHRPRPQGQALARGLRGSRSRSRFVLPWVSIALFVAVAVDLVRARPPRRARARSA